MKSMLKRYGVEKNERGGVNILGMLAIFFATAIVIAVLMLFITGVAQQSLIPRLKARSERAVPEPIPTLATPTEKTADSTETTIAQLDSLRALKQQIRIEQEALDQRIANIQQESADLVDQRKGADKDTATRIAKLAKIYSGMKPAAAAQVMAYLDDEIFMRVFTKIKPAQAAKIMAYSDPVRMARLTKKEATSVAESQK